MSIRLATARPPPALISATTSLAGDVGARSPASVVPKSLTTMEAPCAAIAFDSARPIPPPAPVMAATFPSSLPISFPLTFPILTVRRQRFFSRGATGFLGGQDQFVAWCHNQSRSCHRALLPEPFLKFLEKIEHAPSKYFDPLLSQWHWLSRSCNFGAQPHSPLTRCLCFAGWVAPPPRKIRFRMAGLLCPGWTDYPLGLNERVQVIPSPFPRLRLATIKSDKSAWHP